MPPTNPYGWVYSPEWVGPDGYPRRVSLGGSFSLPFLDVGGVAKPFGGSLFGGFSSRGYDLLPTVLFKTESPYGRSANISVINPHRAALLHWARQQAGPDQPMSAASPTGRRGIPAPPTSMRALDEIASAAPIRVPLSPLGAAGSNDLYIGTGASPPGLRSFTPFDPTNFFDEPPSAAPTKRLYPSGVPDEIFEMDPMVYWMLKGSGQESQIPESWYWKHRDGTEFIPPRVGGAGRLAKGVGWGIGMAALLDAFAPERAQAATNDWFQYNRDLGRQVYDQIPLWGAINRGLDWKQDVEGEALRPFVDAATNALRRMASPVLDPTSLYAPDQPYAPPRYYD